MKKVNLHETMGFAIHGHCCIEDDLGNVLVDKFNAIHPQNMARVFARALAHEDNHFIYRIALGNGGTTVDVAQQVTFNPPNDGQPPDLQEWRSRLYNETYSEIIDDSNINIGVDPGSSGSAEGTRIGGGSDPSSDPPSTAASGPGVRSKELGVLSEVVITCVLNPNEPLSQISSDQAINPLCIGCDPITDTENVFVFDEIGLYTTGRGGTDSSGYQQVDVGTKSSEDDTTLTPSTLYDFFISIDGGTSVQVQLTTPASGSGIGGEITYGDLAEAINTSDLLWNFSPIPPIGGGSVSISDTSGNYPTIAGDNTFGYLVFKSNSTGAGSTVVLSPGTTNDLFASLASGSANLETPVGGASAGVQNSLIAPDTERERLLTHLIFSPVAKTSNRTLTITYTLTISITRTV